MVQETLQTNLSTSCESLHSKDCQEGVAQQEMATGMMEKIFDALRKAKVYASFWDWPNKEVKELGIVRDLLESIEASGEHHGIIKLRTQKPDPPDCVGTKTNGELVAFEVTELVDQEAVEHNELVAQKCATPNRCGKRKWTANEVWEKFHQLRRNREHLVVREWTVNEFVEEVRGILKEKDAKTFHSGPYARVVVVIHTDEPHLRFMKEDYSKILRGQNLGRYKQIGDAYLLFSYDPGTKSYPFLRLEMANLSH